MKTLVFFFLLIAGGYFAYQARLPHQLIGNFLSPNDTLMKADAIVVVSGSDDRIRHAVDLYKEGWAPKIILSGAAKEGPISNALAMQTQATGSGVPVAATLLEEQARDTSENAAFTKKIIAKENFKTIILVTSPYHQRRVYELFKTALKDLNVKLINSPSPYSSFNPQNWWASKDDTDLVKSELVKVVLEKIFGSKP